MSTFRPYVQPEVWRSMISTKSFSERLSCEGLAAVNEEAAALTTDFGVGAFGVTGWEVACAAGAGAGTGAAFASAGCAPLLAAGAVADAPAGAAASSGSPARTTAQAGTQPEPFGALKLRQ